LKTIAAALINNPKNLMHTMNKYRYRFIDIYSKEAIYMAKILKKKSLNPSVTLMEVSAPLVAQNAEPGQFIILRATQDGERIPLTIADFNRKQGTVSIIFQIVGATTERLNHLEVGDDIPDFVGPLGKPTECTARKVAIVGGGVGSAIAYPVAKKLREKGATVHAIIGFRSKDLVILEDEFRAVSDKLSLMTDDGSYGKQGLVTDALKSLIDAGEAYDEVIAIGPLIMMKFVCSLTKIYGVKTTVSMNPIMLDGTGMCGCCRLTVGGEMKFACVDGPDFDGHAVDFAEAMSRSAMYRPFELEAHRSVCELFKKEAV
jgi:ferredoxin--NADP+ reductase